MRPPRALPILLLALAALALPASAARVTLAAATCGAPGAPCGASLPAGTSCPKGAGYCQPGYFCGWAYSDTNRTTACVPVPKDCGKAGKPCCPANAAAPFSDPKAPTGKPTCSEPDTYCFYTPTPDASGWSAPPYASPAGTMLGTCRKVPRDCGTAPGKPCCPSQYATGVNPPLPLPSMAQLCSGGGSLFCQNIGPGSASFDPTFPQGTCQPNRPDCGRIGKSCCIVTSSVSTNSNCGAGAGFAGPQGYCAYKDGQPTGDMRDQVCMSCPGAQVAKADPQRFWGCPMQ